MAGQQKLHLSSRSLLLIMLGAMAWASNPDAETFHNWARIQQATDNSSGALKRLSSEIRLSIGNLEYTSYGFFSIARTPEIPGLFVGAFGHWFSIASKTRVQTRNG